jgi:putative PIG3 family NAD(P)H quinone oxidoreductase
MMKAIVISGVGGPEVLELRDVPRPEPSGDQLRIRVHSTGVNRADVMQAAGSYPAPLGAPKDIPGLEFAGEIDAFGPAVVGRWKLGDRVFGIVSGGGLAEFVITPERMAVPIPSNLDFDQAAAVPEVFLTAHDAIENQGKVQSGERVLIHAVGGGVGSASVQIAHAMGCQVYGTSRTADKLVKACEYGLDVPIDTSKSNFADIINKLTQKRGVHAVIDHVGAPFFVQNLEALGIKGRLVQVGLLGGSTIQLDLRQIMAKRISIIGTTLRARPLEEKIAVTQAFAERVIPWLERGIVRPVIDQVFDVKDVRQAVERVKSNEGFGKVLLRF